MRNKQDFITSAKQNKHDNHNDLITVIIFEKPSNARLKTINFPFIKVNGKSLLEKQIENINSVFKNCEIIFCCGNKSYKIFDYVRKINNTNLRLIENQYFYESNCCESIRVSLNNTFNEKVLILPEDIMLCPSILSNIEQNSNCILTHSNNTDNNFDIGAICDGQKLENLTIGIKQNYWTEILYLSSGKILKEFRTILSLEEFRNKLFFESVNFLNKKYEIKVINTKQCIKLNNIKTLKRINFE